jgi:hypothetical protein
VVQERYIVTVKKPIFIIGAGRSGSSIFYKMFSEHANVAWLSGACRRYPDNPTINRWVMKAIDYPVVGDMLKKRLIPGEVFAFWEHYCKGFRCPCRDLLPADVTNKTKDDIRNVLSEMITKERYRLLVKITGWPRIGFLHDIFDDAKFIHVVRDGRAVANSLINRKWWWGWRGPQNWRWGELTPSQREEWEKYNRSFIALAGIEWKILMDALEESKRFIDTDNFLDVKYENLCSDPISIFKEVTMFCDLDWTSAFEKAIRRYSLNSQNYKWQKELTSNQKDILQEVLYHYLRRYEYL